MLDVISASAPGELFRVNGCNYTGTTVRAIGLRCVEMRAGITGVCDELIPGTAARPCSSPPLLPPCLPPSLPFSSVSNFSPVSGWRQAGPLRAFKSLLEVLGRQGLHPCRRRRRRPHRQLSMPQSPLSDHGFSSCRTALNVNAPPPTLPLVPLGLQSGLTSGRIGAARRHSLAVRDQSPPPR